MAAQPVTAIPGTRKDAETVPNIQARKEASEGGEAQAEASAGKAGAREGERERRNGRSQQLDV